MGGVFFVCETRRERARWGEKERERERKQRRERERERKERVRDNYIWKCVRKEHERVKSNYIWTCALVFTWMKWVFQCVCVCWWEEGNGRGGGFHCRMLRTLPRRHVCNISCAVLLVDRSFSHPAHHISTFFYFLFPPKPLFSILGMPTQLVTFWYFVWGSLSQQMGKVPFWITSLGDKV